MTAVVITQPMLLPWPGFFEQLMLADGYVYLDDVQFSKGSYTNRIQLLRGDERAWMTIPLAGKGSFQRISELAAAGSEWKVRHRTLLRESLVGAPYFDDALDIFDHVYRHDSVVDLLIASIEAPARYMGIGARRKVVRASETGIAGTSWHRVLELVRHCGGSRYVTGHGAAAYIDHSAFERASVSVDYMAYSHTRWPRQGGTFTPFVTILDLIAHTGPRAATYLHPATMDWRVFLQRERMPV